MAAGSPVLMSNAAATTTKRGTVLQAATVANLGQTISGTYTQSEVQAISTKVDALLAALRTAGVVAS